MQRSLPEQEALTKYGTAENFLVKFSPDMQRMCKRNEMYAVKGNHPSLVNLDNAFSDGVAEAWLVVQLQDLSEFSGVKDKISRKQLDQLSQIIRDKYYYLKVTELALFFYEYKAGTYGSFYGAVDPIRITEALQKFMQHRSELIDRYDREEAARKEKEYRQRIKDGKTVTWEQWQEMKNGT